jgi:hypothetical protein
MDLGPSSTVWVRRNEAVREYGARDASPRRPEGKLLASAGAALSRFGATAASPGPRLIDLERRARFSRTASRA